METNALNKRMFESRISSIRSMYEKEQKKLKNIEDKLYGYNHVFKQTENGLYMDDFCVILKSITDDTLKMRFLNTFDEVKDYLYCREELSKLEEIILLMFGKNGCHHKFISRGSELECILCHTKSSDYTLSEKDKKLLYTIAHNTESLLIDVNDSDIPFVYNIADLENKTALEISEEVRKARKVSGKVSPQYLQNYFSLKDREEWLRKVILDENIIKQNGISKDPLALWECIIAKYEILLLSGENIEKIYQEVKDNDILSTALIKALQNLNDEQFKINSQYFANYFDAINFKIETINPEINQKILEMKQRDMVD